MMRAPLICLLAAVLAGLPVCGVAQHVGDCDPGEATQRLDISGVSAAMYNTGSLFWRGNPPHYEVPAGSGSHAMFNTGLWIGGLVDGDLRTIISDYGPWELWPGPLDEGGIPPEDCSKYDRIYKVSRYELREFDETGIPTQDMLEWPWRLGAPVEDGDGILNNYDLDAGDRPRIEGDQTLWWVMNDMGNTHERSVVRWPEFRVIQPLGIEVRVTAFAASSSDDDINYATFYRYELFNKTPGDIEEMYFGMFHDVDVGNYGDDYIGSDTTEGIAYGWNGDDFDEARPGWDAGYGDRPPAIGVTVVAGPVVDGKRLRMTNFVMHTSNSTVQGDPHGADDVYGYLRSLWRDGVPITLGGSGRGFTQVPVDFMYAGRPPDYWSQENTDEAGTRDHPGDWNMEWSTGPFTLRSGDSQEILIAIMFAHGDDRFDSVYKLIDATPRVKQTVLDGLPASSAPRPAERPVLVFPADGATSQPRNLRLAWQESSTATHYQIEIASRDSVLVDEIVLARPSPEFVDKAEVDFESDLPEYTDLTWRVRPFNASGYGPWSETRTLSTGIVQRTGPGPLEADPSLGAQYAFIQLDGTAAEDACSPAAHSRDGCDEVGGNIVYSSFNGEGDWLMFYQYGYYQDGVYQDDYKTEDAIGAFAPNDFEIRVTEEGSYGYHPFPGDGSDGTAHWVPFEVWDIGDVGPFGINNQNDDERLIPGVFSDGGGFCTFGFDETDSSPIGGLDWFDSPTDRIYAFYPDRESSYREWGRAVEPLIEADPERCPGSPATDGPADLIDLSRGPLQNLIFMMDPGSPRFREEMIPVGNVIRFLTTRPTPPLPTAPAPASTLSPPFTLYWQTTPDVDSIRVQLLRVGDPLTVYLDRIVGGDRLALDFIDPGVYYWRLSNGGEDWSEAWSFVGIPATSAQDDGLGLPTELELKPTYPNPSSGPRTLVFGVPQTQRVSLEVFDLLGRRVESISDGERTAGWHSERWDPEGLSAGVYFVVLRSRSAKSIQPIVLAR